MRVVVGVQKQLLPANGGVEGLVMEIINRERRYLCRSIWLLLGVKVCHAEMTQRLILQINALLLQLIMSAYTVMDSVNKYRHGVLVGNFVEDKFGNDLHERGPLPDAPKQTTTKTTHALRNSLHATNAFIGSQQAGSSQFYTTSKGFQEQPYQRPEHCTTYNIFHQQQVNNKVPLVSNNPKVEEQLQKEGKAYDVTRKQLANKFSKSSQNDPALQKLPDQIPDILTGQIIKAKPSIGSDVYVDQKGKNKIEGQVNTKSINPYGATSIVKPQIQKFEEVQYTKFVKPHHKGQKRDVLFGHGLALQEFQRRQLSTAYDLSYGQKVQPQTQVNSFYQPDFKQSAREFHKQTVYEKNYQDRIPAMGETGILGQQKVGRPYQPYTKTYDLNHLKHEYLRK